MQIKMFPGALAIVALVTLAIALGVATPNVYGGGDDSLPTLPEKPELKYPNLGSNLDQLVASVEKGETSAKEAAEDAPVHREASVAVTIYLSGNVDDVVKFLEDNGGSPRNVGEDYIETYVPLSLLGQVSEQPGVIRVREIIPPESAYGNFTSQGVQAHLSAAWNQAGFSGQGIKVGVIDSDFGFNDFMGLMGTELPSTVQARCYTDVGRFTSNLSDCGNAILGDNHGTVVAETVMDIAPEASLYIATVWSPGDLQTATDWMVSQGVSVIASSLAFNFDGPGDGTSPFSNSSLKTVDRAVSGGIVWANAAGNDALSTWFGTYSIVNVDGTKYVAFNGSDVFNDIAVEVGDVITVQLRWEDSWSGANRDFDLLIRDFATSTTVDYSFDPQQGRVGEVPFELLLSYRVPRDGRYAVAVRHEGGSTPGWIQLTVWGVGSIEHYTGTGSIGNPAESSNPGMLAVGAAHWNNVRTIEYYSSRGPTPDRRVKPDIVGATCGSTALRNFCGTSQAAPHVAGMAALVRQRFPAYTAVQVANYLKEHAEQRESPDPNNTWGHGFAKLPPVSECSDAVPSAASNPGLVTDCEALLAARDTLAGSGTLNWSGSTAIGSWDGVTLSGSPLRVTSLALSDSQLTGTIPPELGSLSNLKSLNLSNNRLTGTIPAELGSLSNLESLNLSSNELTGIPGELGNLSNLETLYLGFNELAGPIPGELGNLSNLETLYLGFNELAGPIPTELGSLSNLKSLLSNNRLTGTIPAELGSLSNLESLNLSSNELTGIPGELGNLPNLETLYLGFNELAGPIPGELGNLSNLETLYLGFNELAGPIPAELGSLPNLETLYLGFNELAGPIPGELGNLSNLETLYLGFNELAGTIPAELGSLPNLKSLNLSNNRLTGTIPAELGSLSNLESLNLSSNELTGIPGELGNLPNLETLYLSFNELAGPIPGELGNLSNLETLYLSFNELTGPIPAELGSLSNLKSLNLSNNRLTGRIPAELGSLSNLESLNLSSNQLTGPIPASLGGLANLERLSLSQNMLTGCVPEAWRDIAESDVLELGLPFCAVSLNTAPVFSDSEGNPITEAVRSVVENTAAGENVGAPVTAMDVDNDTLTYSLGGTDMASFTVDNMGQIMVGAGTMLDYEAKASYEVTATATDPEGASDMITVTITVTNEEETGEVTLWAGMDALTMAPQVGDTITGAVMDPDGGVTGETWQWSRTMDDMDSRDMDSWVDIEDATDDEYTVMEGDRGYYLRVMATYMDAVGTDTAMEYSIPTMMVGAMAAEMTLLERYDDGDDGWIQLEEARVAVGDYFFKPKGSKLSLEDARKVVGLYFDYKNRQQ